MGKKPNKYAPLLESYMRRIRTIKKQFEEFESYKIKVDETKDNPQAKLLSTNKSLKSGTKDLYSCMKIMRNTNETDKSTMVILDDQGQLINNVIVVLNDTNSIISRSGKIMQGLLRRVYTNKLILILIIVMLAILIIFLIYLKIRKILP